MGRVEMLSVGCETTCCPRGNLRAICIANLTFLLAVDIFVLDVIIALGLMVKCIIIHTAFTKCLH